MRITETTLEPRLQKVPGVRPGFDCRLKDSPRSRTGLRQQRAPATLELRRQTVPRGRIFRLEDNPRQFITGLRQERIPTHKKAYCGHHDLLCLGSIMGWIRKIHEGVVVKGPPLSSLTLDDDPLDVSGSSIEVVFSSSSCY